MKRSLILILALGLLLLSGCTDKGNVSEDKGGRITDAPTTVKPTVLTTEGGANDPSSDVSRPESGNDNTNGSHGTNREDDPTDRDLGDLGDDLLSEHTENPADSTFSDSHSNSASTGSSTAPTSPTRTRRHRTHRR